MKILLLSTDKAIIVEGKYDKIKLASIINAVIIVTNGFSVFKDREKMELIRFYAGSTGIIIMTDSDTAGFKIRNYIRGSVKDGRIFNVYIPDVFGKEKRKLKASSEGKLGVEGIEKNLIIEAFAKSGVLLEEAENKDDSQLITKADLFELGLCGGKDSSYKRQLLLHKLKLPERLSSNGLLEVLNTLTTLSGLNDLLKSEDDN